ncbi:Rna-directed dna polymerase reverse transcriptase and integrase domain containing [Camponotus japonicus]
MRVERQRFSEINAVSQSTKNSPKKKGKYYEKKTNPSTLHYEKKTNSTTLSPCYGCGSAKHRRDACPFKKAECRLCKKMGHIARVCLSKQRNTINTVRLQGVLGTGHRYRKFVHITINNKPLKMQLDTGADVTTIGRETWTRIGRPKLQPLTTSCVNVSGHPMHTIGFFNASLGYKDCMIKAPVIVLDRPETALISSQAIDELGLITYETGVVGNLQMINTITVSSLHKQFTELFSSSTGECTKMTVHLRLKSDAKPKHIPRRPIALALEEPVNEELDRLVKNGILTPVDFSEWAAPIVVARKANGKIRICADYSTGLNDALDAEDYPIPGIEELMAKLRGSSIFSQLDLSDAYFHLGLDEESKKLTTINIHRGLFAYNQLVFGLKLAPAIF